MLHSLLLQPCFVLQEDKNSYCQQIPAQLDAGNLSILQILRGTPLVLVLYHLFVVSALQYSHPYCLLLSLVPYGAGELCVHSLQ